MAFDALHPLEQTIRRLLDSSRVLIEPSSREILEFASDGVETAVELLNSLEEFRIFSKGMKALRGEIRKAAYELEDLLDSHVSYQFLSQYKTESIVAGEESRLWLYYLDLQGVSENIDGFTQKMKRMKKVFDPWFGEEDDGKQTDIYELSGPYCVARTRSISWCATKAASVFSGTEEEYIKDLENLIQEEDLENLNQLDDEEEIDDDNDHDGNDDDDDEVDDEYDYGSCYNKLRGCLLSWWINKAASIFVTEKEECNIQELDNLLPDEEEKEDDAVSSRTEFALNMSNMVGLTDLFCKIRDEIIEDSPKGGVSCIIGMAGIGKTALAKKILEDPLIMSNFECRIFVRMGPEYQFKEILQAILAQVNPGGDKMLMEGKRKLDKYLYKNFKVIKKFLIVLDDVWNPYIWSDLRRILPSEDDGSWVLVTTRIEEVARELGDYSIYKVPFLNKEESWDLFRGKVFSEESCPPQLEKAGKKIAENCEGLPLMIVTVADLLSKDEKTVEYWIKVAADKENSIFVAAYDQLSEVLYPSYHYLPQDLKTCFLYMGAFPQNYELRISKLINLCSAEGFFGCSYMYLLSDVESYFEDLVSYNIALDPKRSPIFNKLKACSLHSVFWHLCKREARNDKFLHVFSSYTDARVEDIESLRRLSIYKNIVFSIKDVRDSVASMSALRSLLCTGPHHQYQVRISLGSRLLKVLDALTIRFYEFPIEVLKLVHLRYLALTCNENLPPSISELWNLQCLIVHQHLIIKSTVPQSYLPVEVWDLPELEYLQIKGRNLPDPPHGAALRNLLILLDVGPHTCTERVVKSIPNLQKLRVQIELMPDAAEPLSFNDGISHLQTLRSLHCVIVNPKELTPEAVAPAPFVSLSFLARLTLSGFGYPWKDIYSIAELPCLQELKLKCYAFRGEKWEVQETDFPRLRHLSIVDTNLVQWTGGNLNFPDLFLLTIKNCYKLQQIPIISSLREVRLVDCNPSAVTCAKQTAPGDCCFYVDSSWLDDGRFKS